MTTSHFKPSTRCISATMGKYATIQGVRFTRHPDLGERDLLLGTIDACKPKGIKAIPYISTGHKLAKIFFIMQNVKKVNIES